MKSLKIILSVMLSFGVTMISCVEEKDTVSDSSQESMDVFLQPHIVVDVPEASSGTRVDMNADGTVMWTEQDEISVYISGDSRLDRPDWGSCSHRFVTDAARLSAGIFYNSGNLLELEKGKQYWWYALIPYTGGDNPVTPDGKGYCWLNNRQVQLGKNNLSHLSKYVVSVASAPAVNASVPEVRLRFRHLTSIIQFNVRNSGTQAVEVSKIKVTNPYDRICGNQTVSFEETSFSGIQSFSPGENTMELIMAPGMEIEAGGTAKGYLSVIPNTLKKGQALEVVLTVSRPGKENEDIGYKIITSRDYDFLPGTKNIVSIGLMEDGQPAEQSPVAPWLNNGSVEDRLIF